MLFDVNAGSDMTFKWTNVRPSAPIPLPTAQLTFMSLIHRSGPAIIWDLSPLSWLLATEIAPRSRLPLVNGSRSMKVDTRTGNGPLLS